jgi:hypothetical protein
MKPPSAEPPIHYEGHTPGVERVASVTHPIKPNVAEIAGPVQLKTLNFPDPAACNRQPARGAFSHRFSGLSNSGHAPLKPYRSSLAIFADSPSGLRELNR